MSYYVIVWRHCDERSVDLEVPGLQKWCQETMITRAAPDGLVTSTKPRPVDLEWLIENWNHHVGFKAIKCGYGGDCDTLQTIGSEYSVRIEVLPEHKAPELEYWGIGTGDPEFAWVVQLPNGKKDYRDVLGVSQHKDIGSAWDQAQEDMEKWYDKVDDFDTAEWQSEKERLRLDYANFQRWVTKTYGVTPPEPEPIGPGERGFEEAEEAASVE